MSEQDKTELLNDIDVLRSYYSPDTPEHSTLKRAWEAIDADGWRRIETDGPPQESGSYLITFRWKDEGPFRYVTDMVYDETEWEEPVETLSEREIVAWMPLPPPFTE